MTLAHVWANAWPGNYCLRCGLEDWIELALACRECYTPSPGDKDQEIRLCAVHATMANAPCRQA